MEYKLVIQWPASSISDYDTLIDIEDVLIDKLKDGSEVDGHDAGADEMNIFINNEDPKVTFTAIKKAIGTRDFWVDARIAYRRSSKSNYTMIWPEDFQDFKVI